MGSSEGDSTMSDTGTIIKSGDGANHVSMATSPGNQTVSRSGFIGVGADIPPGPTQIIMPAGSDLPKEIAEAIVAVMSQVNYVERRGKNEFFGYKFAAVGDILAKVQPAMAAAGLIIMPDLVGYTLKAAGTVMEATFNFTLAHVSGVTWSHKPTYIGLAGCVTQKGGFDDKALNKCFTAARKYFITALFNVPTGDEPDPDSDDAPGGGNKPSAESETRIFHSGTPSHCYMGDGSGRTRDTAINPKGEVSGTGGSVGVSELSPYEVPVGKLENGKSDWRPWIETEFPTRVQKCTTPEEVQSVLDANGDTLDRIKAGSPKAYATLQAVWSARIEDLLHPNG